MGSKANGALMRITPLTLWAHRLSQHDLVQAAKSDAQLTHPNKTCLVSLVAFPTLSIRLIIVLKQLPVASSLMQCDPLCLVSLVASSTLSNRLPDVMQTACTYAGFCPNELSYGFAHV
jgi:hypothetical protein